MQPSSARKLAAELLSLSSRPSTSSSLAPATSRAKRPRLSHPAGHRLPQRRAAHHLAPLPYDREQGLQPFLTREALKVIAVDYQRGLLERLNDLVRGTPSEHSSLVDTVIDTADDRTQILAFNHASQALNNSFFLTRLRPLGVDPPGLRSDSALAQAIAAEFGSQLGLKHAFTSAAMGLMGSGWIWLVADAAGTLGLIGTYGAGTVLVQNRTQRGEYGDMLEQLQVQEAEVDTEGATTEHDDFARPVPSSSTEGETGGRRSLHTSAVARLPIVKPSGYTSGAYGYGSREKGGARPMPRPGRPSRTSNNAHVATDLYPLLCLSVHEHAWMTDYGLWGREEYATNFWEVVDWPALAETYEKVRKLDDPFVSAPSFGSSS